MMIKQLRAFQMEGLECSSDFDEKFIRAGIREWYGSEESFVSCL